MTNIKKKEISKIACPRSQLRGHDHDISVVVDYGDTKFILFFQIDRGITARAARNLTNFALPNRRDDLCLVF